MEITESFVKTLNEAFEADPNAMYTLQANGVTCNEKLADHPTIVVAKSPVGEQTGFNIGVVGLINGLLEAAGQEKLATVWEDNPDPKRDLRHPKVFKGFKVYKP